MSDDPSGLAADDPSGLALRRENEKLRKINRVLMERVERSTDAQGNAFSLFQAAITLEKMVHLRTAELQSLNRQLRDATVEAERAHLSKTKFFAAASHDLQQPLNIARLFVEALGQREHGPEALQLVGRIEGALDSADKLLATLLEMSRFDAAETIPERCDFPLDSLLDRIARDYALVADERQMRFRVIGCEAIVRTDPQLLERIVRNFVSNAFRYTPRGGVLVGTRRRAGAIRIEVWDTGYGIPQNRLAEIFEEFRQLDVPEREKYGLGLGLGLAIVERVARLLELPVGVRSREGRGSVFCVDVPLGAGEGVAAGLEPHGGTPELAAPQGTPRLAHPVATPGLAKPAGKPRLEQAVGTTGLARPAGTAGQDRTNPLCGKTVLIVDDDAEALDGMAVVIGGWGCRTIAARSAAGAVDASRRDTATPDFIVADYHLGHELTGLDAIERVRAAVNRPVAAVVVTADRSDETRARVAARGHSYLDKPLRVERLRSLIAEALA